MDVAGVIFGNACDVVARLAATAAEGDVVEVLSACAVACADCSQRFSVDGRDGVWSIGVQIARCAAALGPVAMDRETQVILLVVDFRLTALVVMQIRVRPLLVKIFSSVLGSRSWKVYASSLRCAASAVFRRCY